jgi:AcrR family transcriptional regulator
MEGRLGPRERREREREEIRARILDVAREMFATEGYEAVTMRRIADRIEYSPTAIYFHFKDKETLIRELCDADFYILARQFGALQKIPDPIERLKRAGHAYIQFGHEHPNHYRLMFMTPHPALKAEASALRRGNPEEDAYAFVKALIIEAIEHGRFRPEYQDAELVAQTVWAGVHGVISLQIAKCNDDWVEWRPLQKRAEAAINTMIDGLTVKKGK